MRGMRAKKAGTEMPARESPERKEDAASWNHRNGWRQAFEGLAQRVPVEMPGEFRSAISGVLAQDEAMAVPGLVVACQLVVDLKV